MNELSTTILVVEDSADDTATLTRALKRANIINPVQVVSDGRDAIDYLGGQARYMDRAKYPLPFLVFLDLKLPRRDGFEVLGWVRQQPALNAIPFVILSGSEDGLDHQKAYALGARSYLIKPPVADELQRLMMSMQTYWSRFGNRGPVMTQTA